MKTEEEKKLKGLLTPKIPAKSLGLYKQNLAMNSRLFPAKKFIEDISKSKLQYLAVFSVYNHVLYRT